jgi:hypothetical protein
MEFMLGLLLPVRLRLEDEVMFERRCGRREENEERITFIFQTKSVILQTKKHVW